MKTIVKLMEEALPCKVRANGDYKGEECAVYTFNTTMYNGARREARMKVNIAARTMARGIELEEMLDRALVPIGEEPITETCVSCQRNGGGWLTDGDMHIRIAYYDMIFRR